MAKESSSAKQRKHYTKQFKRDVVSHYIRNNKNAKLTEEETNINRATIKKWYLQSGHEIEAKLKSEINQQTKDNIDRQWNEVKQLATNSLYKTILQIEVSVDNAKPKELANYAKVLSGIINPENEGDDQTKKNNNLSSLETVMQNINKQYGNENNETGQH